MSAFSEVASIRERLFELSSRQFAQLVAFVENARRSAVAERFSVDALAAMRPRLRVARPQRPLGLTRIFCRPFEDLLHDWQTPRKVAARIARRAIAPCWDAISAGIDPGLLRELERETAGRTVAEPQWPDRLGPQLWAAAHDAARAVLADAASSPAARRARIARLGGEGVLAELGDMARMLEVAEVIEALRQVIGPRPLAGLNEAQETALSKRYWAFAPEHRAQWEPVCWFVIARTADPVELARAYGAPSCNDPGLHALGLAASKLAIAAIDGLVSAAAAAASSPAEIAQTVAGCGEQVASQLAKLRDDVRGRRFAGTIAEIERVQRELRAAVSRHVLQGCDALIARSLARSHPATEADEGADLAALRDGVELRARAVWKCSRFAAMIGMDRDVAETARVMEEAATRLALEQLSALGEGMTRPGAAAAAQASLTHAVRVVELLAGPDKAEALRGRGNNGLRGHETGRKDRADSGFDIARPTI
jgi:hypothetical protein